MWFAIGWVMVRSRRGEPPLAGGAVDAWDRETDAADEALFDLLEGWLAAHAPPDLAWTFHRHLNNERGVLQLASSRNRRGAQPTALELLRWCAEHGPGSFGVVHVRDEDRGTTGVWVLRDGVVEERDDPFGFPGQRPIGVVEIAHQDGALRLPVVAGGFRHDDGRLSVWLEARATDGEAFPPTVMLGMLDLDCPHPPTPGQAWDLEDDIAAHAPQSGLPRAHAYFSFHAQQVRAQLAVTAVGPGSLGVSLRFVTEDVVYYGESARPTPTTAEATLPACAADELWDP